MTGILLRYRMPTADERLPHDFPLQDLQRSLGLVRAHAKDWRIDPKRVGVIGFSAGANLVGHASWDRTPRTYAQKDGIDDPRGPDFTLFVYGGGFLLLACAFGRTTTGAVERGRLCKSTEGASVIDGFEQHCC